MKRFNELKEEMKKMIMAEGSQELEKLELIDNLQRLGVSYHFKHEIMQILSNINLNAATGDSLYATALKFRLLREHGFHISQGNVFAKLISYFFHVLIFCLLRTCGTPLLQYFLTRFRIKIKSK